MDLIPSEGFKSLHREIPMKAYLVTTGVIFGLITIAHIARAFFEGARVATDPFYILLTLLAAAMCAWAFVLLKRSSRPQ